MKRIIIIIALLCTKCLWAQDWYHVGPFTATSAHPGSTFVPERANCLAVNPFNNDSMYAASKGGLWVSTNAGGLWSEMDPQNNMNVYSGATSVIVGPTSHHLYVACTDIDNSQSDPSIRVYDNQTSTWSSLNPFTSTTMEIYNIQFYPGNEQTIYACTSIGLYVSYDGGSSWNYVASVSSSLGLQVYNIVFATIGTTTYSYVSGNGIFMEATDGWTFSDPGGSAYSPFYGTSGLFNQKYVVMGNLCLGNVSSGSFDIYFLAACYNFSSSESGAYYQVMKYTRTGASSETAAQYYGVGEYDNNPDRLALGYTSNGGGYLFFGGVGLYAINTATYTPSSTINFTGNGGALLNLHSDQHFVLDVPGSAVQKVFFASDGSVSSIPYSAFSSSIAPSQSSLSWNYTGLDICQIVGLSGPSSDTTLYLTGELDRNGEVYDFSTSSEVKNSGIWENYGGIIEKFSDDTIIGNMDAYVSDYYYSVNGGTAFSSNCTYDPVSSTDEAPGTSDCLNESFGLNAMWQDPARPSKVFYGSKAYLFQWEEGTYVTKIRPNIFPSIEWGAEVLTGTVSPMNKNAFFFLTANRNFSATDTATAKVIKFNGPDFDDCWMTHNEDMNHWHLITPNFKQVYAGAPWNYTFTTNDVRNITIFTVAVSSWDSGKVWVGCSPTSKYPGIKVLAYNHGTWTDYSSGIPSEDLVRCLVMENGSNDGMYLGTNRAIYYRNATMSSWQVFNNGPLPGVQMSQMEINYFENKLRVGTYGRGIWESSFYCPSNSTLNLTSASPPEFDEASDYITSTASNISSSSVYYRAGEYVSLNTGFRAISTTGSVFHAFIHPCSGPGNSSTYGNNTFLERPQKAENNIEQNDYQIQVFPNPNGGSFTLNLPVSEQNSDDETSNVFVYNLLGATVYNKTLSNGQVQIDLSNQPKGIYFVKATDNKTGKTDVKKVIIQ
jgi:hypothetical protein